MKTDAFGMTKVFRPSWLALVCAAGFLAGTVVANDGGSGPVMVALEKARQGQDQEETGKDVLAAQPGEDPTSGVKKGIIIRAIEPGADAFSSSPRNSSWMGVSTEEASEALTSQLDLAAGVGLVVTYVVPESPAAKVGLKKNDLLVELDGQALVLPAQLRKLLQVRKAGDEVNVVYYRGGKKQNCSLTLAKQEAFDKGFSMPELKGVRHADAGFASAA